MFLTALFERRATLENPQWSLSDPDAWRTHFDAGRLAETAESVGVAKALTLSPVWMAVKMISGDCSKLPLKVYRYRADGDGKDVDRRHQTWPYINRDGRANDEVAALQLWRRFYASALLWENGYIWIDRDDLGRVHGLYNLPPDRTAPLRVRGRLWCVTEVNGRLEPLYADDVLHLQGLCWDNQTCPALVEAARHDFGVALAARKFTSKFFANGAQHGGVLQVPPGASKEARDKVEQGMEEKTRNLDRAFKTLVLRDGYKWFSTTVDPSKAQLLELDEAKVRDVARWFMLSPSRLGVSDSTSYNSEEHAKQDYYDTTLSYWLSAAVAECNCKLLTERQRIKSTHVFRYQINALLWANAETRSSIAVAGIQAGRFSPDETRDWEGLNPRPDGEGSRFLRPLNMEAVGDEPIDTDPDPDTETEPAPAAEGGDDPAAIRSVFMQPMQHLVSETLDRCWRRLVEHGRRAAARGDGDVVATLEREHRAALEAWLDTPLALLQAVRKKPADDTVDLTPASVVGRLFASLRTALEAGDPAGEHDSSGVAAADTMRQAFAAIPTSPASTLAADLIAQAIQEVTT